MEKRAAMTDPLMVRDYFAPFMADKDNEEVWVLLLDNRLHVIADRQISKGGISEATVDVRLVLREALLARATAMILVHNHPTGNVLPSDADDRLTKKVADAGKLMNITLRDHVIVGGDSYYSYCEQGKL